jgi:hypothetical protein
MPAIKVTTEIELDIDTAAKWFAHLSDDEMCRFLVAVAEEAGKWPMTGLLRRWKHIASFATDAEAQKYIANILSLPRIIYQDRR